MQTNTQTYSSQYFAPLRAAGGTIVSNLNVARVDAVHLTNAAQRQRPPSSVNDPSMVFMCVCVCDSYINCRLPAAAAGGGSDG